MGKGVTRDSINHQRDDEQTSWIDVYGDAQATMASVNGHFSTAGDMKAHLQSLLDSKEHQLQQAATFGQRVLAQRMELEERIRQLQEVEADKDEDDDVDPEAADKYKELADTVVSWDNENAELSSVFSSSKVRCATLKESLLISNLHRAAQRLVNGLDSSAHSIPIADSPRDEPERSRTSTSTSAAAQSRRAKNAAHRADDVGMSAGSLTCWSLNRAPFQNSLSKSVAACSMKSVAFRAFSASEIRL